ncbi:acyl carrier protein [Aquamicrobium ahrensii]|uniref:Acyl carrier protein n=1 Tax=Aquamicrobium ahrensii TaxID=469551 RepID=A0ABV2KNP3_9HYPH
MSETAQSQVRIFVVDNFLFGDQDALSGDDQSLIEHDVIDSTGVLELVSFIEERFGIAMSDAEIAPANLDSVSRIAAFIERKRAAVS